jgi:hypothetical protein
MAAAADLSNSLLDRKLAIVTNHGQQLGFVLDFFSRSGVGETQAKAFCNEAAALTWLNSEDPD